MDYVYILLYGVLYYNVMAVLPESPGQTLGKCPCIKFQGANVAASIQTYAMYIPGKCPCEPKSQVMFSKHPWALT